MKNKLGKIGLWSISALMLASNISQAFAETEATGREGHGGLAWVCRNQKDGAILSAELLDLVEGRKFYGLVIPQDISPADLQIEKAKEKLEFDKFLPKAFDRTLDEVRKNMSFTSGWTGLPLLPDAALISEPMNQEGCEIEQLAIFYGDRTVKINQKIYERLDQQSIAALFVHETIYFLNRVSMGANRSVESREMTARLFSDPFNKMSFEKLANEKLPTIEHLLQDDPVQIQLKNSGDAVIHPGSFATSTFGTRSTNGVNRLSLNGGDIRLSTNEIEYNKINVNPGTICFYQNNILLEIIGGSGKYKTKKSGCISIKSSTNFILIPADK